jgi:hypothetical protein
MGVREAQDMTQFLQVVEVKKRLPELETDLCYYINATPKMQILRIRNISNWYFERVIFAQERLFFYALCSATSPIRNH